MKTPTELENKYSISIGLVLWFLGLAITATFSLTMIYNRFLLVEEQMSDQSERVEYVNDRIDRKVKSVEDQVSILEDRIDYLENYIFNSQ